MIYVSFSIRFTIAEVRQTEAFLKWIIGLHDKIAAGIVLRRIDRMRSGLFGGVKYFDGIGELRMNHGPGCQIYFASHGDASVMLLCRGDRSTQERDTRKARQLASDL